MKKLMILGAAALCATVGFSDIESSNTVGYSTKALAADTWAMVGAQFTDTATGTGIALQDFIQGDFEAKAYWEDELDIAPQIQSYGTGGYTQYFYFSDATRGEDEVTAWSDINGDAVDVTLAPGQAVWFKNPTAACEVTIAGQVLEAGTKTINCTAGGWNMIANPYPVALALNGNKVDWNVAPKAYWEDELDIAPQIQVYGTGGYTQYFYFSDATRGEDEVTAWSDINGDAADVEMPIGGAMWFKASDATTVTFSK